MHLGSQQIAPACVQSNLLGLGIGSWCCVVEPMLTELVKTTTATTIYKNQTGDEPQKQDTQANKRTPLLREEVPYQITLIRLRQWQGSLDRRLMMLKIKTQ